MDNKSPPQRGPAPNSQAAAQETSRDFARERMFPLQTYRTTTTKSVCDTTSTIGLETCLRLAAAHRFLHCFDDHINSLFIKERSKTNDPHAFRAASCSRVSNVSVSRGSLPQLAAPFVQTAFVLIGDTATELGLDLCRNRTSIPRFDVARGASCYGITSRVTPCYGITSRVTNNNRISTLWREVISIAGHVGSLSRASSRNVQCRKPARGTRSEVEKPGGIEMQSNDVIAAAAPYWPRDQRS